MTLPRSLLAASAVALLAGAAVAQPPRTTAVLPGNPQAGAAAPRLAAPPRPAATAAPATSPAAPTGPVQRREVGQQVLENVPVTPPEVRERLRRYQNVRSASFVDWLPDGAMLISTRFGATAQLHRVAAPGAARTQLTFYDEPVAGARVAPDGSGRYVFSKDTGGDEWFQLILSTPDGAERPFTVAGTRNESQIWSDDGRTVVFTRRGKGRTDTEVLVADLSQPGDQARVVFRGDGAWSSLDVSPDGRSVLLGESLSNRESRRHLLDLATGQVRRLTGPERANYGGGEFTPDGRSVLWLTDRGADFTRLVRVDLSSGGETRLTPDIQWDVDGFDLSRDGRTLAYEVNEDGMSRLVVADLSGGALRVLGAPRLPQGVVGGFRFSPDGRSLGLSLSSARSAGDVYSVDVASGAVTRWTTSELAGLDPQRLAEPRLVRFQSFDDRSIPAWVYRPTNAPAGARLPVVIDIHGGPESQTRAGFNSNAQTFSAELGAVVIQPNVRGSTGYGRTYADLDNAEKREDSVRDIGALLDWIAKQPDLDPSRVAVYGGSYGGYMSLASMTHYSDRLAGGVELFGISDWTTFLQNTEAYRRDNRRAEYGDERDPKMAAVFARISPLANVDRIRKPMLVMQGANDPRVPQSESEQIVRRLRQNGVETWYVLFRDEGHGFRKKPNNDARREAEIQFLQKILRTAR